MKDLFLLSNIFSSNHNFVYIFHLLLIFAIILILSKFSSSKMSLAPSGLQNIMEAYLQSVLSMGKETLGSTYLAKKYLPLVASIGLFVFFANLIGIIPGFESPSASLNFTFTLAILVFFYYNIEGIKEQGFFNYFKHFAGPNKLLAPIMFVVEIISHLSRIISLSFRLFGNIKGDDLFLLVMLTLAPWFAPLPAYALLSLMAVLQSFIFMMLTYVYLAGAMAVSDH